MCAIVGVFNHPQASVLTYYALHALQHRGQEATGIVSMYTQSTNGRPKLGIHKGEGLVLDVFSDHTLFSTTLKGTSAVGHNRYSTTGSASLANIQPFHMNYSHGYFAVAHNGNLTNTRELRNRLKRDGSIFQTTTDSELFLHLVARSKQATEMERIQEALRQAEGAFSLVMLTEQGITVARDAHGFRPLCLGKLEHDQGTAWVIASESCAFDIISAEYVRDIEHNEIAVFDDSTKSHGVITTNQIHDQAPESKRCIFEFVYFSRPDSRIFGENVDRVRRRLGKVLAEESPVGGPNDDKAVVISVPDSGNTATLGYARVHERMGLPTRFEIGLIRSHYVGRTFIAPGQNQRELKVKSKFNIVRGVLENMRVVVVDDSIVRGTTSRLLVALIRGAAPREVHLRITSPPVRFPCVYGMDFPSREELVANKFDSEEGIAEYLGVDSLRYLSVEGLLSCVPGKAGSGYCTACFTGEYPVVPSPEAASKLIIEE